MPFREKTAWITLVAMIAPTLFFASTGLGLMHPHGFEALHFFLLCVIAFVVLKVVLQLIAAAMAPKEARAPADERERLIGLRAGRNAHVALIVGVLFVPLSMHLDVHYSQLGFIAMLALMVSEVVRAASRIVYYRLDS